MKIDFSKAFNKQFEKLPRKRQQKVTTTLTVFLQDATNPSLRLHSLKGEWQGYESISAGGDIRLHFKRIDQDTLFFVAVGSHSQLYK